ncbi:MAG: helix-turn-helix transcriptional regulator [Chthoniobacterales bacterium]|nr:helix-turn-helix transcriptional regulator [Chthoniobacterales bacterium]
MRRVATRPKKAGKTDRLTKSLHSPLHERFVHLIRAARLEAGLSQVEAAAKLGIRQSFISDIERGQRRVDVVEFVRFCGAYGIRPAAFFRRLTESEST